MNKNGDVGEYLKECAQPEFAEREWDRTGWVTRPNWRIEKCEVEKVLNLTASEYDHFSRNLMQDRVDLFAGVEGGSASSYEGGRDVEHLWQWTDAEKEQWIAHSYQLVVAVQAPGRMTYVVNSQGYDYARYVGLEPKAE